MRSSRARPVAVGMALLVSAGICPGQPQPRGPEAVARQDPSRVVAIIEGKQITARQAMDLLRFVAPPVRREREAQLPKLVQRLYMQRRIAEEAVKLHLDQKPPWKAQLQRARMVILQGASNYPSEPEKDLPPAVVAQWHGARAKILWRAYFSQASTKEGNAALLKREQDNYKIQVRDPDFFNGVTS